MRKLQVTWDEIIALIEKTYAIENIEIIATSGYERDRAICETPSYIIGNVKQENH